ncbi:PDZ domain-containing protein [Halobacillus mangrovi]|uniref:PDZ domain-containing protein n=1 Tax=Halobacillus mangrovi TaxID=402384 RepID=A0A1W5ZTB2_9BACI|nr:PDZ domain-containing protein [Halobacillus mangrovi]ARI76532.1 PDZ domain-containing protein [Halobacillus mangrovi]
MELWFLELIKGLGRMFIQPYLYIAVLMVLFLSQRRIKEERKAFGTRIFDRFSEWKGTLATSLIAGGCLSIFSLGAGMVLPLSFLWLLGLALILVSLPLKLSMYSASYSLGITALMLLALPYMPEYGPIESWKVSLLETPMTSIAVLMSVMLFVEAVLLLRTSKAQTFPERIKGSRGMWTGQHRSTKMAIVPFVALFPAGSIEALASWWPLLHIGEESFGLVLVPFVIGWEWVAKGQSPEKVAKTIGRHTFVVAIFVLLLTIGSIIYNPLSLAAIGAGLVGRIFIQVLHRLKEGGQSFFSPDARGLRVLGVIPKSPGAQMGLTPGELIVRVNARQVRTERQFYEALQLNGGFNKIEVRDEWGENRYVQRALYEGEHYELGLVFLEPPEREETVGLYV